MEKDPFLSQLQQACRDGDLKECKWLVDMKGVDINHADNDGRTPLFHACEGGSLEVCRWLVDEKGFHVNNTDAVGRTPLFEASLNGSLEICKWLIDGKGADVNHSNHYGQTSFFAACVGGSLEINKWLVEVKGVNVNHADNDGRTPLFHACLVGSLEVCRWLVDLKGVDINITDNNGRTLLFYACYSGHLKVCRWLVDVKGFDVNHTDKFGRTALFDACWCNPGFFDVCLWLVNVKEVNVNHTDNHGRTALFDACRRGSLDLCQWLVHEKGAKVNHMDRSGKTPLLVAKNRNVVNYLELVLRAAKQEQLETQTNIKTIMESSEQSHTKQNQHHQDIAFVEMVTMKNGGPIDDPTSTESSKLSRRKQNQQHQDNVVVAGDMKQDLVIPANFAKNLAEVHDSLKCLEANHARNQTTNMLFAQYRGAIMSVVVKELHSTKENIEIRAIFGSEQHADFYHHLRYKLRDMVFACETLASEMVASNDTDLLGYAQKFVGREYQEVIKAASLAVVMSTIESHGGSIGALVRSVLSLRSARNDKLAVARVAYFAAMAMVEEGRDGATVVLERTARLIVRARCQPSKLSIFGSSNNNNQFGQMKKHIVRLLGIQEDTPQKEKAKFTANAIIEKLMSPDKGSKLEEATVNAIKRIRQHASGVNDIPGLHEVLAACVLGCSVNEVRHLPVVKAANDCSATQLKSFQGMMKDESRHEEQLDMVDLMIDRQLPEIGQNEDILNVIKSPTSEGMKQMVDLEEVKKRDVDKSNCIGNLERELAWTKEEKDNAITYMKEETHTIVERQLALYREEKDNEIKYMKEETRMMKEEIKLLTRTYLEELKKHNAEKSVARIYLEELKKRNAEKSARICDLERELASTKEEKDNAITHMKEETRTIVERQLALYKEKKDNEIKYMKEETRKIVERRLALYKQEKDNAITYMKEETSTIVERQIALYKEEKDNEIKDMKEETHMMKEEIKLLTRTYLEELKKRNAVKSVARIYLKELKKRNAEKSARICDLEMELAMNKQEKDNEVSEMKKDICAMMEQIKQLELYHKCSSQHNKGKRNPGWNTWGSSHHPASPDKGGQVLLPADAMDKPKARKALEELAKHDAEKSFRICNLEREVDLIKEEKEKEISELEHVMKKETKQLVKNELEELKMCNAEKLDRICNLERQVGFEKDDEIRELKYANQVMRNEMKKLAGKDIEEIYHLEMGLALTKEELALTKEELALTKEEKVKEISAMKEEICQLQLLWQNRRHNVHGKQARRNKNASSWSKWRIFASPSIA